LLYANANDALVAADEINNGIAQGNNSQVSQKWKYVT